MSLWMPTQIENTLILWICLADTGKYPSVLIPRTKQHSLATMGSGSGKYYHSDLRLLWQLFNGSWSRTSVVTLEDPPNLSRQLHCHLSRFYDSCHLSVGSFWPPPGCWTKAETLQVCTPAAGYHIPGPYGWPWRGRHQPREDTGCERVAVLWVISKFGAFLRLVV